jgi:hypothetical protein
MATNEDTLTELADGESLEVYPYEHHDERVVLATDDEHPIVLVLSRESGDGPGQALCFSPSNARSLRDSLTIALAQLERVGASS